MALYHVITPISTYFITIVILISGTLKIIEPQTAGQILALLLTPIDVHPALLGTLLGGVEVIVGLSVLLPQTRRYGFRGAFILFLSFALLSVITEATGIELFCGCFGSIDTDQLGFSSLPFQLILLLITTYALILGPKHEFFLAKCRKEGLRPFTEKSNWLDSLFFISMILIMGFYSGKVVGKLSFAFIDSRGRSYANMINRSMSSLKTYVSTSTSRDIILIVFSPQCPACREHLPFWKEILTSSSLMSKSIILISPANERSVHLFMVQNNLIAYPYIAGATQFIINEHIPSIPTYILLDRNYKVKQASDNLVDLIMMLKE